MSTLKVDGIRSNSATSDAITLASDGTCTANITNNLSNRNLIINGAMQVAQRGSTFAAIAHNAYSLDRYKFTHSGSAVYTISKSTTSPDYFANSLKIVPTTADTSIAATDYSRFLTVLEGQDLQQFAKGTSSAKKAVLSFYVKTNKTGTYSLFYFDSNNNRQFNATYTVSNTNWNRYTIPIAADTTGAFTNNNNAALEIYWHLVAGSNRTSGSLDATWNSYTSAKEAAGHNVNFADSTSNEFYITGIQLEVDHTSSGKATDFEHRSFGQELDLCKRYFQVLVRGSDGVSGYAFLGVGAAYSSVQAEVPMRWEKEMRSFPSFEVASGTNYFTFTQTGSNAVSLDTFVVYGLNKNNGLLYQAGLSGLTTGKAYRVQTANNAAYAYISAEF